MYRLLLRLAVTGLLGLVLVSRSAPAAQADPTLTLSLLGHYDTDLGTASAETVAYEQDRLFITNSANNSLDIVDLSDPAAPTLLQRVPLGAYGAGPNSVDVRHGRVAVAMEASPKTADGQVVFFDRDGNLLNTLGVGALPDMLTYSPDGRRLLVANEGEPNSYGQPDSVDPEGTVSIITLVPPGPGYLHVPGTVKTVDFRDFNVGERRHDDLPAGVRIFGPNASVAQDLEPEYVAVSDDNRTAYVTLQENNALAVVDLRTSRVTEIRDLGRKDHSLSGHGLDASDRDMAINIAQWPVHGTYQPDAVAFLQAGGADYLLTANEGDARDYTGLAEEIRLGNAGYVLDPTLFPNAAALKANARLGRLNVSRASGDTDGDGDFDRIDAFGARSFTIWNASTGARVFDSGDGFEQKVALDYPAHFNASNDNNNFDDRSDNKGPEPEGLTTGAIDGRTYAFIVLERVGGLMVFDIDDPAAPVLVDYVNNRNFATTPPGPDSGPEMVRFVAAGDSPSGRPLVITANEISGTVGIFEAN
jgi:DNA-binding beta-propeller fold protein YncE